VVTPWHRLLRKETAASPEDKVTKLVALPRPFAARHL
jgi:hypothetical protein